MATAEATPNPVPMGETFKVEGTGFDVETRATLSVNGEEVATAYAHQTPDGGVVDFFTSIDEPGTHEVDINQDKESASVDVEVVTGWPEPVVEEPAAEPKVAKKAAAKDDES